MIRKYYNRYLEGDCLVICLTVMSSAKGEEKFLSLSYVVMKSQRGNSLCWTSHIPKLEAVC